METRRVYDPVEEWEEALADVEAFLKHEPSPYSLEEIQLLSGNKSIPLKFVKIEEPGH